MVGPDRAVPFPATSAPLGLDPRKAQAGFRPRGQRGHNQQAKGQGEPHSGAIGSLGRHRQP